MGGQLLDVEQRQPVGGEDPPHGGEREVGEVLVVDGVELVLLEQPQQVRELHRDRPARRQRDRQPGDEVVELRHVGEDVVADDQVGPFAARRQLLGEGAAEEPDAGGDALRLGRRRPRSPPARCPAPAPRRAGSTGAGSRRCWRSRRRGSRPEPEALDRHRRVGFGVAQPALRVGGEVGVVGEDRLGRLHLRELHQQAAVAEVGVERVEGLRPVEVLGAEVGVGQRRQPRSTKVRLRAAAEAAGRGGVSPRSSRARRPASRCR